MAGDYGHRQGGVGGENSRFKKLQDQIDAIRGRSVLKNAVARAPLPFQTEDGESVATVGETSSAYFNGTSWIANVIRGLQFFKVGDTNPFAHIAHAVGADRLDVVLGGGETVLNMLWVEAGDIVLNGPDGSQVRIHSTGEIELTPAAGHWITLSGATRTVGGGLEVANGLTVGTDIVVTDDVTVGDALRVNGNVGFYNTAPVAKPTVSGSRAGNAALADLLNELDTMGLINNSSSA
jgi:hypothetical protein